MALAIVDANDISAGLEREGGSGGRELDVDGGKLVQVGAIRIHVANEVRELVHSRRGANHEGGTSINDARAEAPGARATRGINTIDSDRIQRQRPVVLRQHGHSLEATRVVARVNTTKVDRRAGTSRLGVEVDSEHVLLDQALRPHKVKGRSDEVSSNAGVGQTYSNAKRTKSDDKQRIGIKFSACVSLW